jgi:hypothetical protein
MSVLCLENRHATGISFNVKFRTFYMVALYYPPGDKLRNEHFLCAIFDIWLTSG